MTPLEQKYRTVIAALIDEEVVDEPYEEMVNLLVAVMPREGFGSIIPEWEEQVFKAIDAIAAPHKWCSEYLDVIRLHLYEKGCERIANMLYMAYVSRMDEGGERDDIVEEFENQFTWPAR